MADWTNVAEGTTLTQRASLLPERDLAPMPALCRDAWAATPWTLRNARWFASCSEAGSRPRRMRAGGEVGYEKIKAALGRARLGLDTGREESMSDSARKLRLGVLSPLDPKPEQRTSLFVVPRR